VNLAKNCSRYRYPALLICPGTPGAQGWNSLCRRQYDKARSGLSIHTGFNPCGYKTECISIQLGESPQSAFLVPVLLIVFVVRSSASMFESKYWRPPKMSTSSLVIPESLVPYLTGQLTDYSSLQGVVFRCNIVFITIVVISSGLRMFVRFRLLGAAGLDDGKSISSISTPKCIVQLSRD